MARTGRLEAALVEAGVPGPVASELARVGGLAALGQVASVSRASGRPLAESARAVAAVGSALSVVPIARGVGRAATA